MNEEFSLFPDHARVFILFNSELPVVTLLLEVLFLHLSCLILTGDAPTPSSISLCTPEGLLWKHLLHCDTRTLVFLLLIGSLSSSLTISFFNEAAIDFHYFFSYFHFTKMSSAFVISIRLITSNFCPSSSLLLGRHLADGLYFLFSNDAVVLGGPEGPAAVSPHVYTDLSVSFQSFYFSYD